MDMQIQWFGLLVTVSSLVGLGVAAIVALVALVKLRRSDTLAGLLLAGAATIEGLTILVYLAGVVGASVLRGDGIEVVYAVQNVISVIRPLAHAVVLVLVVVACMRLTRHRT